MLRHLIYGKVILDALRLSDGRVVPEALGGGGPQALWGAALWSDSVGFLSRCGSDLPATAAAALAGIGADLAGVARYEDLPTLRGPMLVYDETELMRDERGEPVPVLVEDDAWERLLARPLALPPAYQQPRLIHLISEYAGEPMVRTARALQERGAVLALEPLIDYNKWRNAEAMLGLIATVDVVTPDWRSASVLAGSEQPAEVMAFWSQLGPRLVAVRHGEHGSYLYDREEGIIWQVPPAPVSLVDPTGAGNSYGGGLAVGWSQTGDARLAGARAAVSASFLLEQPALPARSPQAARGEAEARLAQLMGRIRPLRG